MPSEPELKEIHGELLLLLKNFHKICVANGVKYTLHGGTLLGAIREKGFIPWDNDADVAMLHTEYDKFREATARLKNAGDIKFDGSHRVPRLILKKSGTFLDIFLYDPISDSALKQKIKRILNLFLRALVEDKVNLVGAKKRKKYPALLYWGYDFLQWIGGVLPQETALKVFNQFNRKCFYGSGKLIFRSNDGYPALSIILPAETMMRYEMTQFEDAEFMISSAYRDILTSSYGEDYMVPKKIAANEAEAHEFIKRYL